MDRSTGWLEQVSELRKRGRFSDALRSLEAAGSSPQTPFLVVKLELLELVGDHAAARFLAERLLRSVRLTTGQRASCENVLGRVLVEDGQAEQAISRMQRALGLAQKAGDRRLSCWIQCKLLSILAERSGRDAAAPLLADLRRNVTQLGDADATAEAHMFVAEMEGRQGHLDAARRHVLLGQKLLNDPPNAWLAAFAENILLAISILEGKVSQAKKHSQRALALSEESGAASAQRSAAANTGNLLLLCGDFEGAFNYFERALTFLRANGERNNGILEALAQVRLAQNLPTECASLLTRIESAIKDEGDRAFYGHRYAELTAARLLAAIGSDRAASRKLERVISLARQTNDELLHTAALLTKALWLQKSALWLECAAVVKEVVDRPQGHSPETLAIYNGIIAKALKDTPQTAVHFQRRCGRLFSIVPNVPRANDLGHDAVAEPTIEERAGTGNPTFSAGVQHALHSVAVILTQVTRAEIVAAELAEILTASGAVESARVIDSTPSDAPLDQLTAMRRSLSSGESRLVIDDANQRTVELVVDGRPDFQSQAALNLLRPIVEKLRDLRVAAVEAERRAGLWPVDADTHEQSGAIISGHMRELMTFAQRVARTSVNVMITGESGTGKEILARAVHDFSDRAQKPFVPLNCAAVPRDLLESQLFGHRRGAFTGADRDHLGLVRSAEGGTVFLDEIGEMGLDLQPKLLRFLESGEISPLGEPAPFIVSVRVIAATNANLEDAVRDGKFREDLFYRLNVVRLAIRPLRERRDEIPSLVTHFVDSAAREYKKGHLEVSEETMERLLLYRWPGNVRQLQNEIRRMVALAEPGSTLEPDAISADILGALPVFRHPSLNGREVAVPLHGKLAPMLSRIEYEMIKAALRANHGRLEPAARSLGISRKGLYLKRQRLGL
jgi:DNA-binding NtrC family response regulator/tetratricopeptide (TPR) repeat protein